MTRTAVYVRISQDREGGGLGVERQEKDCRALARRKGWKVTESYVDNDVSASSRKPRPEWNRLLTDVEAGKLDAVAVWHVDRLTRSPAELEHVIDQAERHGLKLATVTGDVDLATPTGRLVARMLGAAARHEIEHKVERQLRERRQSAERGRPNKGGTRAYGYEPDRVTIIEAEAAIICECARRVLEGETPTAIARDLQRRDVHTPSGGFWQPRTLTRMLASARISGRREHRPVDSHGGTRPLIGQIVAEAEWPAIITADDSDRLRALFTATDRKGRKIGAGRTYLFSGILRCGRCGHGLVGRPRSGEPRYVCSNMPGTLSCGRLAANAAHVDATVRELFLDYIDSPTFAKAVKRAQREATGADKETATLRTQLTADRARFLELTDDYDDGKIDRGEYQRRRTRLEGRIGDAESSLARIDTTAPAVGLQYRRDEIAAAWENMTLDEKRTVVSAVVESIVVRPVAQPTNRWNPDRVEMIWRF
ncbi:MAG: recombinase family protein [Acidimicrobiia bacterium]